MRRLPVYLSIGSTCLILAIGFGNCSRVAFDVASTAPLAQQLGNQDGAILINNGADYTNLSDVTLSLMTTNGKEMYVTNDPTCASGGTWEPYTKFRPWTLSAKNAEVKVYVSYRESATSIPGGCVNDAIIHDDIPPSVNVVKDISGFTNNANVPFEFNVTDNLSGVDHVDCTADRDWSTGCNSSIKVHNLKEGAHSIQLQATDKAGNVSPMHQSSIVVDLTPPTLAFVQVPPTLTSDDHPTITFAGQDALSGVDYYECKTSAAGAFARCTSPFSSVFPEGVNQFSVRATDKAGNTSVPITYQWTIDKSAPSVRIISGPAPISNTSTATFTFDGNDNGQEITKFECSIDNSAYAACTSPKAYMNLSDGNHNFAVRGYDNAGNVSAPATYTWLIDTVKPTVTIITKPNNPSKDDFGTFTFTASDSGSGVKETQCQLDGSTFATCTSAKTYMNLTEGNHTFGVRAVDNAGNIGDAATYTWRVDLTKPVVTITSGPAPQIKVNTGTLTFVADDGPTGQIASIECQFDTDPDFSLCTSPKTYQALSEGQHLFKVRATDTAGNVSDVKSYTWFVDTLPPAINFGMTPAATIYTGTAAQIQFSVTDAGVGVDTVMCGLNGTLAACLVNDTKNFANLPVGNYSFRVQASDKLGNSTFQDITWTVAQKTQQISQNVLVNSNNKADVLVVIDNSGSMKTEQGNMASRFGTFLDKLQGLDWQVGIVTTDVEPNQYAGKNKLLTDGHLLQYKNSNGLYILNSGMDLATAKTYFANTIQRPANEGSGNEQGIAATYRTIQRTSGTLAENAPNRDFFRDGAVLSVLVVTDADETNPNGTQTQNKPQELINLVHSTFPNKPFKFNSIIVKINDSACLAVDGNEGYGYSYTSLSQLTGGVIGTVCSQDYGNQLSAIGQATIDLINSVDLTCVPLDTNGDGTPDISVVTADGSAAPTFTLSGLKVTFSKALPPGTNRLVYTCAVQ